VTIGAVLPMNNPLTAAVFPDMRTPWSNGKPRRVGGWEDGMSITPDGRRRAAAAAAGAGQAMAGAVQLAIGLLTASLDSPELEAWAVKALIPHDAEGLGDFMAGLHIVSELLLHRLQEATGEPPAATLQELAILAETLRGTPSVG
jgi:hypothetical protein